MKMYKIEKVKTAQGHVNIINLLLFGSLLRQSITIWSSK